MPERMTSELFENAFLHAGIGMALVGLDGRFLRVNPAYCRILGYSEPELLALDFQRITHPDDLKVDLAYAHQLREGEIDSYQMEKRYIRKDGDVVWIRLTGSAVRNPSGEPLFFVAQVEDINPAKTAEQERDLFFRLARDLFAIANHEGYLIRVNRAWHSTLGWTNQELTRQPYLEFVHPDDLDATLAAARQAGESGGLVGFVNRYRTRDGDYRWLEWNTQEGPDSRLYCAVRDITERKERERELKRLQEQQRLADLALENSGEGIALTDRDFRIIRVNQAFTDITGYSEEEAIGCTPRELLRSGEHSETFYDAVASQLHEGRVWRGEMVNRRKSGELYHQRDVVSPLSDAQGCITNYVAVLTDISEAREAEAALQRERNFFENVIDGLPGHFFLVNRNGRLLRWNEQVETSRGKAGITAREVLHDFFVPEQRNSIEQALELAFETGSATVESRLVQHGGATVPFLLNLHCFRIDRVVYAAITGTDISRQKAMEARLEELANTDRLTSVYNRGRLDQLLALEVDRANRYHHPVAFIIFDIDHFKRVNDEYGHRAGDDVLRGIARHAARISRHTDYFGRWGGEEFVLIAPETGLSGALDLAEKLRGQIQGRTFGPDLQVTASFGVAVYHPGEPLQDVVIRADGALYKAKESGRNRVCGG